MAYMIEENVQIIDTGWKTGVEQKQTIICVFQLPVVI